jgi:hypothetical protein
MLTAKHLNGMCGTSHVEFSAKGECIALVVTRKRGRRSGIVSFSEAEQQTNQGLGRGSALHIPNHMERDYERNQTEHFGLLST